MLLECIIKKKEKKSIGVAKHKAKQELTFIKHLQTLENHECDSVPINSIRSKQHPVYSRKQRKPSFCNQLFNVFGIENCKMKLIESVACKNRKEPLTREGHHIKNTECLNRCVAGRTINEWTDDNKKQCKGMWKSYSESNKEYICQRNSELYNKNEICEERKKEHN